MNVLNFHFFKIKPTLQNDKNSKLSVLSRAYSSSYQTYIFYHEIILTTVNKSQSMRSLLDPVVNNFEPMLRFQYLEKYVNIVP